MKNVLLVGSGRAALLFAALAVRSGGSHAAEVPTAEQMWAIIQQQQKTIEELKAKLETTEGTVQATRKEVAETGKRVEETDQKVEATVEKVEEAAAKPPAASWVERTHVGGYGELHYNNWENDEAKTEKDEVDFHRFVLYLAHDFNDWIHFYSEIEIEHALVGDDDSGAFNSGQNNKPGEVELEQAYLELDIHENQSLRAGLQLLPVGILNETHEPNTFYGVERNLVETNIIPSTWWEAGLGVHGELLPSAFPGLSYNLLLHSGLQVATTGANAFRVRQGRQKVAEAPAADPAFTGQLKYTGIPGVEVGFTGQYQSDVTSSTLADDNISATLFEGHLIATKGPFGLRALAARWDLDDGPAATGPATGPSDGRDVQWGWYVEPSFRFDAPALLPGEAGVFARYSEHDNNAGDAASVDAQISRWDVGLNYWPHPDVVFKFDYQNEESDIASGNNDGFNLGLGYAFF